MTALGVACARLPARPVLLVGTLALLALRLAISLVRSGPVIMADEAGYLFHARVLAGGMAPEMGSSPFYRGGYSLLVAPVLSLDLDPVLAYHGVLAVNAVLAAAVAPLLYLLLTRCFDVERRAAAWAALAGAAYPSLTALSQVALSENALFGLTIAWLLALGLMLRAPASRTAAGWAAAAAACAAALWTVHGRMVVVIAVTVVVLLAGIERGEDGRARARAGLLALIAGMLAGHLLNDWLLGRTYGGDAPGATEAVLSSLDSLDGILAMLRNIAGHGWYLLVATLGIVLLVLPGVVAALRARRVAAGDHLLLALLATTLGLLLVSALWFATTTRPDQLIYGRYVEPVVPALVAVGLVLLGRAERLPRPAALVAGLAALTVVVAGLRSGLDLSIAPSRWNVASLPSVTGSIGAPVIVLAGAVASGALWLFARAARRAPAALAPLALLLFAPTTAYVVNLPVLRSERDVYPPGWTSPRPVVEHHGSAAVGYDLDHFDHIRVKAYQWALPDTRVVLFRGEREPAPAALFFSGREPTGRPARTPATAVWRDPGADQTLWERAAGR